MPLLKDPNKSSGFNISPMDGEEASPKESIKQGVEKAYLQSYTDLTSFLNEKYSKIKSVTSFVIAFFIIKYFCFLNLFFILCKIFPCKPSY